MTLAALAPKALKLVRTKITKDIKARRSQRPEGLFAEAPD
jgi:hypothetical protein